MMFWRKKQPADWPLIFFGLIALGIIVSVAILLVIIFSKVRQGEMILSANDTPPVVVNQYYQELEVLERMASSTGKSQEEIFKEIEDKFLTVRVPAELRDSHLRAWFEILELKEKSSSLKPEDVRQELKNIFEPLLEY